MKIKIETSAAGRRRMNITNVWVDSADVGGAAQIIAALVRERSSGGGENSAGSDIVEYDTGVESDENDAGSSGVENSAGSDIVEYDTGVGGDEYDTGSGAAYVCTPNAEFMMDAQKDAYFRQILNEANLTVADGAGVVLAARLLGYGKIARAPGFDLAKALINNPSRYPFSYYFLGGRPGVAEKAARNIVSTNPTTRVSGFHDGYFQESDEPAIIKDINDSGADILFVALGAPKAEKWIYKNRKKLRVALCIGVGGTIDIFAGTSKPAPPFFRSHGLEWMYRLYREPWRARRMLKLPQYILFTIWWIIKGRPELSAPDAAGALGS